MPIKKYSKVKFTLRKEFVIILSVIVVMILATVLLQIPTKKEKFEKEWSTAGASYYTNDVYKTVSMKDLGKVVAADEYTFVFFATSSDSSSVKYFDSLYTLASGLDVKKIYLVDASFAVGDREEDSDLDATLKDWEAKYAGIDLTYVPNLWVFKNGTLVEEINHDLVEAEGDWNAAALRILSYAK